VSRKAPPGRGSFFRSLCRRSGVARAGRLWVKAPGAENAGPSLRTPRASALLRGVVASTPAMPPRGKVRRPGADRAPFEISSLKLTGDHIAAREAAGGAHSPPLSDQQHTCAGRARRDWKSRSRLVYVSRTPARKAGVFDLRTRTRTRDYSLLEGAGFEPSVPAVKERPFVRNFDFRTAVTDRSGDNQEGRMVRIRLPSRTASASAS
jgi:hypothetical protein